ncbi:unnamed protein product, partial [Boreogadus saida]
IVGKEETERRLQCYVHGATLQLASNFRLLGLNNCSYLLKNSLRIYTTKDRRGVFRTLLDLKNSWRHLGITKCADLAFSTSLNLKRLI